MTKGGTFGSSTVENTAAAMVFTPARLEQGNSGLTGGGDGARLVAR
jgi:hypothetical protein